MLVFHRYLKLLLRAAVANTARPTGPVASANAFEPAAVNAYFLLALAPARYS
jgi:hypothetical protein